MSILDKFLVFHNTEYSSIEKFLKKHKEEDLLCKCGKFRKFKKNGSLFFTCGARECHNMFGKIRPNQSKIMKEKYKQGDFLSMFQKGRTNSFINTIEWKRKVLQNKEINTNLLSDLEVETLYLTEQVSHLHSRDSKVKKIQTIFNRYNQIYDLEDLFDLDNLQNLTDEDFHKAYKLCNSIQTLEMNKNGSGGAKRFKRVLKENFNFNLSEKESLLTRSMYESHYIDFFEKNRIWWDYETLHIKTLNGFYIPDFCFYYKDKKYILEVKGFLLDENEYFNNKIKYCEDYAQKNGYEVLFTYDAKPKSIEDLINKKVVR